MRGFLLTRCSKNDIVQTFVHHKGTHMSGFHVLALLLCITAAISFIGNNIFKLKGSIGLAISGSIISVLAFIVGAFIPSAEVAARTVFHQLNFHETVFHGILCFLLFAGAMHIDLKMLSKWKWHVGVLATIGVGISAAIVSVVGYYTSMLIGLSIPFAWWFVVGAAISPTDPIAVLSLLKMLNAPKDLESKFASESLLNDGSGIVLFIPALAVAVAGTITPTEVIHIFATEALGGGILGIIAGLCGHKLLAATDDAPTETAMTLAFACGGYAFAELIHVSAPLFVAIMGIVIGNGKHTSMAESTREHLLPFWSMLDELMNMSMFALVGLAMMASEFSWMAIALGSVMIIASLSGRLISVSIPVWVISKAIYTPPGTIPAMVWGGLRGGLSLALIMSLPDNEYKQHLVTATWMVVMFSLLVQAPTMKYVLTRCGVKLGGEQC